MEFLTDYGISGLFIAAFLAATILPLSSEAVLFYLLSQGMPATNLLVAASLGNLAGAVLNYYLGRKGHHLILQKLFRMDRQEVGRAEERFRKYGTPALLLSWVPVIGDPLTVVAGIFRVRFSSFLLLVGLGKTARYAVIIFGVTATGLFS